jgi:flagellar hook protein FlgE
MIIKSISGSALQGIQRGLQGMRRNAGEIASARQMRGSTADTVDLTRALVEMKQTSYQTTASVKVLRTADQMIGTLLDVKA